MATSRLTDGRLKIRHLLLVDALTQHGSVVRAAAALHVTQPVVTRGLRDVEDVLGVQLYERGPRGIEPTEFGLAFTDHARAVLAQLAQATKHVQELADGQRGEVVVGTHLAGSNLLLPRAIAHMKAERPGLTIVVREGTPDALAADLSAGRIDLVVGRLTGPSDEGLRRVPLHDERIRVAVGVGHPLAVATEVELADLMPFPWVVPGRETVLRGELEAAFGRAGLDLPTDRVETTSFLTVRQLLIDTRSVAALPGLIVEQDPDLTALPVQVHSAGHEVGMTLAQGRRLSPATRAMIDSLKAAAQDISRSRHEG